MYPPQAGSMDILPGWMKGWFGGGGGVKKGKDEM